MRTHGKRKEITIEGDTSQSIDNDNGGGMWLYWMMGAGTDFNSGASTTTWADYGSGTTWFQASATNNVVTTASATWQLTGVQLEVGEKATPFSTKAMGQHYANANAIISQRKTTIFTQDGL